MTPRRAGAPGATADPIADPNADPITSPITDSIAAPITSTIAAQVTAPIANSTTAPSADPSADPIISPIAGAFACPVCTERSARLFATVGGRDYLRCEACRATFLHPDQLPARVIEQREYALHQNQPEDPAYRAFLGHVATPLLARLAPGRHGLDYGCGPGPVLARMLREAGHRVALYDPFFHPDPQALEGHYDFITCTEVAEHFHHPAREFERLDTLLEPGGWLAVGTVFQEHDAAFARWNYRRDPTHVVFYRTHTFVQLAARYRWTPVFPTRNVVLLRKQPAPHPPHRR